MKKPFDLEQNSLLLTMSEALSTSKGTLTVLGASSRTVDGLRYADSLEQASTR